MSLSLPAAIRLLLPDGTVKNILLEDYLRGVVAAALPADAPLEAMKALAVAARTFAAHTHRHLERGADLCTARHCQAWNERANPRAARAVLETRSIVATFHDHFIEAFYFEHCDGKTRDAQGVLVNAPAYLKSVACPCGFAALKGHGIGMCLRGMVAMARLGESYDFILRHYYSDIALEQIGVDESTRVTIPVTPTKRATPAPKPTPRPRPAPRVAKTTEPPPTSAAPVPVEKSETPKPAPKPTPRRSTRPKIEHAPTDDEQTKKPTPPTYSFSAPPRIEPKPEIEEADDFVSFLAVEDVKQTTDDRPQTTDRRPQTAEIPLKPQPPKQPEKTLSLDDALHIALGRAEPPSAASPDSSSHLPPSSFAPPPPSVPEEFTPPYAAPPPPSMPEDLPNALELEFIAPPTGAPEEVGSDFLAPPTVQNIEPDLDTFLPPVEKFYTPLDAPPSMPEEMPSFRAARADETPIAWVPPPPLYESAAETHQPKVLMDALPGPRVIAGNLPKPGMLVTVRDAAGNSIITVSGVAKHYGAGGFEAPLTDDGAYHVKFDGVEMDVQVESETVFIYYQ
jgi:hypothetical protein